MVDVRVSDAIRKPKHTLGGSDPKNRNDHTQWIAWHLHVDGNRIKCLSPEQRKEKTHERVCINQLLLCNKLLLNSVV